jgi:hypothetical protein
LFTNEIELIVDMRHRRSSMSEQVESIDSEWHNERYDRSTKTFLRTQSLRFVHNERSIVIKSVGTIVNDLHVSVRSSDVKIPKHV